MSPQSEASAGQLDDTARERAGPSADHAQAERKPAGDAVGEQGIPFRALVEQENAGIYIIAADGTVAYVNPYFMRMVGHEPAEVIGRPMLEFIAKPERAAATERFVAQMTDHDTRGCGETAHHNGLRLSRGHSTQAGRPREARARPTRAEAALADGSEDERPVS